MKQREPLIEVVVAYALAILFTGIAIGYWLAGRGN